MFLFHSLTILIQLTFNPSFIFFLFLYRKFYQFMLSSLYSTSINDSSSLYCHPEPIKQFIMDANTYIISHNYNQQMPPKVFKKQARDQLNQKSSSQDNNEKLPLTEKWDINIKSIADNTYLLQRISTLTSILAGVISGLFNANLYGGVFVYISLHLILSLLIAGSLGNIENYFLKKSDLLGGVGGGVMVFLGLWIITYNVVYTL